MASECLFEAQVDGWEYTTLGEVCARGNGEVQTGPFGSQLHAADYVVVGIPSIMPQNIGDNRIIRDGIARITLKDAERLSRYRVRAGDIVYSRRGDVERRALVRKEEEGWLCGTGCLRVRFGTGDIDPAFASFFLGDPRVRAWIVRHAQGATMPNLNTAILSALPFVVPPLKEQESIAHILGALDDKIELNRKMNETLEAMVRALFKSWFVDFDPVRAKVEGRDPCLPASIAALFPDAFEESELGEIPKGWTAKTLDEDFNITMGQSPPGDTYNEKGDGLPFFQGRTDFEFRFPRRRVYCTAPARFAEKDDTLVSVRAPVGDINIACERCCIGRGVAAVRHASGGRSYTYYTMQILGHVFDKFEGEGTVFGSISKKDFHAIKRPVPPRETIAAFERLADPLDGRISANLGESESLTRLRDLLLPKLISGELRVKDFSDRQGE